MPSLAPGFLLFVRFVPYSLTHACVFIASSACALLQLVQGSEEVLRLRLAQSSSIASFLHEFRAYVLRVLPVAAAADPALLLSSSSRQVTSYFADIVREIDALGWENVTFIDADMSLLVLTVADKASRKHEFRMKIPQGYPNVPPAVTTSLPTEMKLRWSVHTGCLSSIVRQFQDVLEEYDGLWSELAEFDRRAWVLEPTEDLWSGTMRRVAITANTSIQVILDAAHPRALPECHLLGPDHTVAPLRARFNASASKWNSKKLVIENLELILGMTFMSPEEVDLESFSVECGICYSYKLDGKIPEKVCDDRRCGRPFHQSCLVEWIRALPETRQSFDTLFGECPYCGTAMTVKLR